MATKKQRAAAKKKAQPKQRARRTRTAPRRRFGPRATPTLLVPPMPQVRLPHLDPRNPMPLGVPVSEGSALPVTTVGRFDIPSSTLATRILCIGNTGISASLAAWVDNIAAPSVTVLNTTMGGLNNPGDGGSGPTSGRAMKTGFELINFAQPLSASGQVYILCAKQRLFFPAAPSAMSQGQWASVIGTITSHPDTKLYAAVDFVAPKSFYGHVVDEPAYRDYQNWVGTETVDQFFAHSAVWPSATERDRPMSFFYIVLPAPATGQGFTWSIRNAYYTRWPINTLGSLVSSPVPVASQVSLNKAMLHAEIDGRVANGTEPMAQRSTRGKMGPRLSAPVSEILYQSPNGGGMY